MQIGGGVFLVTGGASGLGGATAKMLAGAGGKVVIADLKEAEGSALAEDLGGRFVRTDVTDDASGKAAVAAAVDSFGTVHGLINCAGVVHGEKVLGKEGPHALATFARVVNINLVGTFNMVRLAAGAMAKNAPNPGGERGVIVNTASVAAFDGQMGQAAYAASKAAVAGMTLPLARDLSRNGIRVMTIAPGIFGTPMLRALPQDVQDSLGASVPFPKRLGETREFAALVLHCIHNSYLNGEVIRLDGALRMAPR